MARAEDVVVTLTRHGASPSRSRLNAVSRVILRRAQSLHTPIHSSLPVTTGKGKERHWWYMRILEHAQPLAQLSKNGPV